jgi:hypothetical protein
MTLGHGWPCSIKILFKPNFCFILFYRLFSRSYYVCLNLCLVVIGLLRPIWLFHDPYNEELSWPRPVAYLLVDTGLPCMTSAFAVLFLALLRATQIELVSPSFQVKPFFNYYNWCCHSMSSFGGMLFGIVYVSNISCEITKCNYINTRLPCMVLAFAVLFLALIQATQIELVSRYFR